MPKNAQTTAQLHSSHTLVKWCSKFSKPGFNSTWTVNFQMFKLALEKAVEPEIKLTTSVGSSKKQEFQKNIYSYFIDYAKAFNCVDHNKLLKILRDGNTRPPDLPLEKPVCRSGSNRTGHGTTDWFQMGKGVLQGCTLSACLFNLYAEYSMRNAGLEEAQLESRLTGKITITSDMQVTPPIWQKEKN